ncbi:hypothetical protein BGX31_006715 [Mortierella sp. GBA43]|nr:hypothetical protein BGX31_006715 [Mortierella sp. GBA43]
MQEEWMLTRRQKTLSSISNYIPLRIILNQPAGVTFSITVPKSFTVEQLARQIEAEYAFLVERQVGHSRYPVIECGALFDHIELDRSSTSASAANRNRRHCSAQRRQSLQQQQQQQQEEMDEGEEDPCQQGDDKDKEASEALDHHDQSDDQDESDAEASLDQRGEAESRGVQLRFSDKVEDVLDRNSTVHVVNIDQGTTTEPSSAINTGTEDFSNIRENGTLNKGDGAWRPVSVCSTATDVTTTSATGNNGNGDGKTKCSTSRQRSRATDVLLNLEASSNDARFQEILHNTIALDHFRQFCFQEYSIENLLFWMDVELFAKSSEELSQMGKRNKRHQQQAKKPEGGDDFNIERLHQGEANTAGAGEKSRARTEGKDEEDPIGMVAEQFAVQHARYIYLTYIDSCGPLQVNLSDESRSDIPWPILDCPLDSGTSDPPLATPSLPAEKKKSSLWGLGGSRDTRKELQEAEGWPLDRHMFDGAQEHTYQLMKGHTLVRFEESDLWKAVVKIKKERPEDYAKAMINGPLNTYYRPDKSVILSTVKRSRSRHPSAKPQTLYNWNNSTSDLDRSRDKEEALAKTMGQYFGPIPASLRRPGRVILGLGNPEDEDDDDEFEDCDEFDTYGSGQHRAPSAGNTYGKASSTNGSSTSRKSRFAKRLSGTFIGRGDNNKRLSYASEETMGFYHEADCENEKVEIDSVKNGKRITRWMVAGYFNDEVRLTAAQRKRLLRRNNKLTKFFGSRVDGTLRPVEEIEGIDTAFARFESSSAPTLGSPLAYALSSSTIHDMEKKPKLKKLDGSSMSIRTRRGGPHDRSSEMLALLPGTTSDCSTTHANTTKPRSSNLLQRFRRNPPEVGENQNGGYRTFDSFAQPHAFEASRPSASLSRGSIFKRSGTNKVRNAGHLRSLTTMEAHQPSRMLAHPHPLWSGSLSDHEGHSSAYERRRGLSIVSMMGNGAYGIGGGALTPTTPTGFGAQRGAADQAGMSMDRQAMLSRRKKADKLSTFFGAQLTTRELSSQLPMELEGEKAAHSQKQQQQQDTQQSSNEPFQEQPLRASGPTYSSMNQLSSRERSILWRRNKKLRGLLGESLPEAEVALALTQPLLMTLASPKPRFSSDKASRRRRQGSVNSKPGSEGESQEYEDVQQDYGEDAPLNGLEVSTPVSMTYSTASGKGKGRTVKRSGVTVRSRRLSNVSASSRKSFSRPNRGYHPGLHRATSNYSLKSFQTIDSVVTLGRRSGEYDDEGNLSSTPASPRRRFHHGNRSVSGSGPTSPISRVSRDSMGRMSRFSHKKKVDKIHQFLGDRVPEQDLWMGTVGRERTQEMLDLNLLSPTSSVGSGSTSFTVAFGKHSFPGLSSRHPPRKVTTAMDLRTGSSISGRAVSELGPHVYTDMGGVKLERSLSDPPKRLRGRLRLDGSVDYPQLQQQQQQQQQQSLHQGQRPVARHSFTMTSRLRKQLASGSTTTADQSVLSGIGQLLLSDTNMNVNMNRDPANVYSSPLSSGPPSPLPTSVTTAAASGAQGGLLLLEDPNDDESAQILPRLRAMSGEDQERFLKRAEKLEKYFGHFPPSSLLESSLTTPSSYEETTGLLGCVSGGGGLALDGRFSPGSDPEADAEVDTDRPRRSSRHKSLIELAGLLTRPDSRSSSSSSDSKGTSNSGLGLGWMVGRSQKRKSLRPNEDMTEPLAIPIPETQFRVEL